MNNCVLVTGGAGFIGSALIRYLISETDFNVVNVDCLTYAGNLDSLEIISGNERYFFEEVSICDRDSLSRVFDFYKPSLVMHLAAESHVDRSIENASQFIETNVLGTFVLLEASREYWLSLSESCKKKNFGFTMSQLTKFMEILRALPLFFLRIRLTLQAPLTLHPRPVRTIW